MNKQWIFLMMMFLISAIFAEVGKVDTYYIGITWIALGMGIFVTTYVRDKRRIPSEK